jgi:ElaB/YqjD/DUF883 family membrane-anchored ribosome-binding protein
MFRNDQESSRMATPPTTESERAEAAETGTTPARRGRRRSTGPRTPSTPRRTGRTATRRATVSRSVDATITDITELQEDLARLSRNVAALIQSQAVSARDKVTDTASELYETGVDYAETAERQVKGFADELGRQVEKNPLGAIGIAFGIGYIIGLLRRR